MTLNPPTPAVLDTNVLLLPFTHGTDIQEELMRLVGTVQLIVPSSIAQELGGLAEGKDAATSRHARAALRFMDRCRIEPTGLPGDDGILEVARRMGGVVVTNDRKVRKEARRSGLKTVGSRGHGRLGFL